MGRRRKHRKRHPVGGCLVRIRGRSGWYGQYRIGGRRRQALLRGKDGKTPIADDDVRGAETALVRWVLKVESETPGPGAVKPTTLEEFLPDFLRTASARVGERHLESLLGRCARAAEHFGTKKMHEVDKHAAETYFATLSKAQGRLEKVPVLDADGAPVLDDKGRPKTRTIAHPITARTLRYHRDVLSTAWDAAIDAGHAKTNPWREVRMARTQDFAARLLTHDEVRRIVDRVRADARPIVEFLAETGVRVGEAQELTWQQVHADFSQFVVARSKSGRTRVVPCTARAKAILSKLWDSHVAKTTGPDLVFRKRDRHFVWRQFKEACTAAGVTGRVRLHDLRHYVGTSLAQAGVPIPTIMAILGHSQIEMTQRYAAHIPKGAAAAAIAALDASRGITPPAAAQPTTANSAGQAAARP